MTLNEMIRQLTLISGTHGEAEIYAHDRNDNIDAVCGIEIDLDGDPVIIL